VNSLCIGHQFFVAIGIITDVLYLFVVVIHGGCFGVLRRGQVANRWKSDLDQQTPQLWMVDDTKYTAEKYCNYLLIMTLSIAIIVSALLLTSYARFHLYATYTNTTQTIIER